MPKLESWTQDMIIVNNFDFHRDSDRKYFSLSNFRTLIRVVKKKSWAFLNRRFRTIFYKSEFCGYSYENKMIWNLLTQNFFQFSLACVSFSLLDIQKKRKVSYL